jgi:integrase
MPPATHKLSQDLRFWDVAEELAVHPAEWPPGSHGFVFSAPQGGPLLRRNFRRREWLPAVRRSVSEPMRFHDLRHTHAAMLIAQGEHPKVIQNRLGHSSIKITLDTYGTCSTGWMKQQPSDSTQRSNRFRPTRNGIPPTTVCWGCPCETAGPFRTWWPR